MTDHYASIQDAVLNAPDDDHGHIILDGDRLDTILNNAARLSADHDALLAYAKMLEDPALDGHMFLNNRQRERTREIWRVDSNVAHLFD